MAQIPYANNFHTFTLQKVMQHKIDDYTGKWSYTIKDLNTNTEVILSFFAPNIINIGLIILGAVIIVIILIVLLIRRRKR